MLSVKELKYYSSLKHKKYREEYKRFLIEGFHLVEECLASDYKLECIIVRNDVDLKAHNELFDRIKFRNTALHTLKPLQFNKLSETKNSQGIIGVVRQKKQEELGGISSINMVVALEHINDPGNLGTIIRTAYWFGVDSILLSTDSVELYNPKVIRSTQGAIFHMNIYQNVDLKERIGAFYDNGFKIYLLTPTAGLPIERIEKSHKTVLVFGNESGGLSKELLVEKYEKLTIPGYSKFESLNLAVSCGIALYHFKTSAI